MLFNSSPYGFFVAHRGLRQGDPLSHALFTIFSVLLSRMIEKATLEGSLNGVKVERNSSNTHLMYADDLVIYCKATEGEASKMHTILMEYCKAIGQEINWSKSSVHYSYNTRRSVRRGLCRIMGVAECTHDGSYLAMPFCKFKIKNTVFQVIIGKLAAKLGRWRQRTLSMAGRTTLVKSVLQSTPIYTMKIFQLPIGILRRDD